MLSSWRNSEQEGKIFETNIDPVIFYLILHIDTMYILALVKHEISMETEKNKAPIGVFPN